MKKIVFTLFYLSFCTFAQAQKNDSVPNTAEQLNAASTAVNERNYLRAIRTYEKILQREPKNAQVWFYRGQAHFMVNDSKNALADYNRALELQPQLFDALLSRAILYYNLEQPERAINDYNLALRYCADSTTMRAFLLNNRGNAQMQRLDYAAAYNDFVAAFKIDNQVTQTMSNLALALNALGRSEEALVFFQRLAATDSSAVNWAQLGYTYAKLNQYEKAIEQYDRALTLQPDEAFALNNRGLAKLNLKDYAGALADVNYCLSLYPNNAYAYRNRGMIYISMQRTADGCADFRQALQLNYSQKYDSEVTEFFQHYCK